jgi:hypothetical protein
MKSTGTSKKSNADSGGSFGIGKNAPFAISDFHTVFVLTRYQDKDRKICQLAQGKSILMSHGKDGTEFTNNAYWGTKKSFGPLEGEVSGIPAWMNNPFDEKTINTDLGTSIFIAGFRLNKNWDKIITAYIIQNFFAAIQKRDLVVEVGEYRIDETTLADLFGNDEIEEAISVYANQPEGFQDSRYYFECMQSAETIHETSQQQHLGKTAIGILLGEQYPKKVAFVRNGMLITDNLYRLQRFPGMKNFVSVVECQSSSGNELLKQMEPPRHDEFEPERLATDEARRKGRSALKQLAETVRKHLDTYAKNPVEKQINLDELSELLGSDAIGADRNKEGEVNPTGNISLASRRKPNRPLGRKSDVQGKGLGQGFDGTGTGGDLNNKGTNSGKGAQPSGTGDKAGVGIGDNAAGDGTNAGNNNGKNSKTPTALELRNVRGVSLGANQRRISFTPPTDGTVQLSFERVGVDTNTSMDVSSVSGGKIIGTSIVEIDVKKMTKAKLDVTFASDFEGAVKVTANAI